MKQYTVITAVGIAAIVIVAVVFGGNIVKLSIPTQEYDIFVDPILDKQSLFVMGRVTIQNTGSQPLTNIHVNFGAGDTLDLKTLKAGQKSYFPLHLIIPWSLWWLLLITTSL